MGIETLATAATYIGGGLLAKKAIGAVMPKIPTPEVKPVLPMPDPMAQEAARKKQIADVMQRGGRASTIQTQPTQTLGG